MRICGDATTDAAGAYSLGLDPGRYYLAFLDPWGNTQAEYYNNKTNVAQLGTADLVTVTTPALAERYGSHGRVKVLPNLVPASYFDIPTHAPRKVSPTVGWTGSVVTHVGDLDVMGGVIPGVLAETGLGARARGGATCGGLR